MKNIPFVSMMIAHKKLARPALDSTSPRLNSC